jgi:predicted nucleotidyltransferase
MKYVWQEIEGYIKKLTGQHPSIQSIWLFGSRINGTSRPDSDWDLLVFGTQETIDELSQNSEFNQDNIDLLVVYNGNDFKAPWPAQHGNGEQKSGSLKEWCWKKLNHQIAFYEGTKDIEGNEDAENFYVETKLLTANRIFPE